MRRPVLLAVALVLAAIPSAPARADDGLGETERRVLGRLSAAKKAGTLTIHYEPTAWMKTIVPEFERVQTKALADLERALGMKYRGEIHVFVYLDAAEMRELTGAQEGVSAYAAGSCLHTPFHTLPHHELSHILCSQWNDARNGAVPHDPAATDYGRNEYKFVVEGLADALTHVGRLGVPIRSWVAVYRKLGWVPPLATVREKFPTTGTRAPGYWIAGSFFEWLVERHGIRAVKRYYFSPGDAAAAFGKDLAALEAEWLAWLDATTVDAERIAWTLGRDVVVFEKVLGAARGEARATVAGDDAFLLLHDGRLVGGGTAWDEPQTFRLELDGKDALEVYVVNEGGAGGLLLEVVPAGASAGAGAAAAPLAASDATWTARRQGGKPGPAVVVAEATGGVWGQHASPQAREALGKVRGSWIWAP